jgi:uncharacterized membrane protein required for colicin V production
MTWVDALVILTLAVAFWGGYRSGAVREAVTIISIVVGWLAAGSVAGAMVPEVHQALGLAPASAHLLGFWLLFLVVFALVRLAGWAAERTLARPLVTFASKIGGGIVACAKAVLVLWFILFVALFFPIAGDVRSSLRASPSARLIASLDTPIYGVLDHALPKRARPFATWYLKHHHL